MRYNAGGKGNGIMITSLLCVWMALAGVGDVELVDFGAETLPEFVVLHDVQLERTRYKDGYAMKVEFKPVDWPNVFFQAPGSTWDWSAYAGVAVSLHNPTETAVPVAMRVDNAGADGANHCNNASGSVPPGEDFAIAMRFKTGAPQKLWGMRGVPSNIPLGQGPAIDTSKITAFQVFLPRPQQEHTLLFLRAWLIPKEAADEAVMMPFIDRFGQYKHAEWPGKVETAADLQKRAEAEQKTLKKHPALSVRDEYGGWADGPALEATGWFRTEQVNSKWWLVTPTGHLFFSVGVDCVGPGEYTFVEGRKDWFEWLPGDGEAPFAKLYREVSGAHSHAEPIDGKGRTFSFYAANLIRKYGEAWSERWRETTYARLRSWGFNTIANWSQAEVLAHSPMPYVVSRGVQGVRPIEGGGGYWAKMKDVYDPAFAEAADKTFASVKDTHAKNPLCIGYFVDNELAWEEVRRGALNSPKDQPCRMELVRQLQERYSTIEALNAAWGAQAAEWDSLKAPEKLNEAAEKDLDAFLYTFAKRYFEVLQAARQKYAPHQLFLGCRFSTAPDPVIRACADVADIVSFNLYHHAISREKWYGPNELRKPIIIGEFHFGALDRGMFHTGLVATRNQEDRAESYARYVRSVVDHPAFIGCHWFQYVDEPTTGRWFDGENYNIGFVNVTDTPYPELVDAARKVHSEIYTRRY